jgi:hypothetical protein
MLTENPSEKATGSHGYASTLASLHSRAMRSRLTLPTCSTPSGFSAAMAFLGDSRGSSSNSAFSFIDIIYSVFFSNAHSALLLVEAPELSSPMPIHTYFVCEAAPTSKLEQISL